MDLQMTRLANYALITSLILILLPFVIVESKFVPKRVLQSTTNGSLASSPWLNKVTNGGRGRDPRPPGCWNRPWICRQGEPPGSRMRCCRNRCVDVSSDVNHCGLCGTRCPFTWQCCRGFCSNTNVSRFNCGKCGNRCARGVRCYYGMCGYAQPWPKPRPRPPWPRPPPGGGGGGGKQRPPWGGQTPSMN
ncbi:hypothetical protein Pint_04045 [Pistacia integerrima]|uniref:Uncharacterized protein n=1 Tax=Pistacia integerrima TaxID=434235 RepID=A0ACC0Z6I8_9ROSI|nr:hypothetical protein Pint_04045 [Pistacia integerrima]